MSVRSDMLLMAGIVIGAASLGFIASCVHIVLVFCDRRQKNSSLGIVILSLDISNVLVSISSMFFGIFTFYINLSRPVMLSNINALKNIAKFLSISLTFSFASTFIHCIFIALHRLFVVMYPLRAKKTLTKRHSCVIIILLWVLSGIVIIIPYFEWFRNS